MYNIYFADVDKRLLNLIAVDIVTLRFVLYMFKSQEKPFMVYYMGYAIPPQFLGFPHSKEWKMYLKDVF